MNAKLSLAFSDSQSESCIETNKAMPWLFPSKMEFMQTKKQMNVFLNWSLWERSHSSLGIGIYCDSKMKLARLHSFAALHPCLRIFGPRPCLIVNAQLSEFGSWPMSVDLDIVSHDFSDSACVREVSDSALEGKAKSHNETGFDHSSLLLSLLLLSEFQQVRQQCQKEAVDRWGRNPFLYSSCFNNSLNKEMRDLFLFPIFFPLQWHGQNKYCSDLSLHEHQRTSLNLWRTVFFWRRFPPSVKSN